MTRISHIYCLQSTLLDILEKATVEGFPSSTISSLKIISYNTKVKVTSHKILFRKCHFKHFEIVDTVYNLTDQVFCKFKAFC